MSSPLRIKICGVTRPEDARLAAALGADAIGLNFCARSPRRVAGNIESLLRDLPPLLAVVGVYCSQPLAEIFDSIGVHGRISAIQWHGDDPPFCSAEKYAYVPAFPVIDRESLTDIQRYVEAARSRDQLPSAVLVDGHVPGQLGGTGQTAPWHLLADFRPGVPLILAGGLSPDNVAEAVRIVRPYAVDVASGVESSPGVKDADKMRRFIDYARAAV